MYILGISADHNASAALLKDGKVIVCVSEERFNRIKNYFGIPKKSIEYCLNYDSISAGQLDAVVVASELPPPQPSWGYKDTQSVLTYKIFKTIHQILMENLEWRLPFFRKIDELGYDLAAKILKEKIIKERIKKINEVVKAGEKKIIFVDHHLCHALTALYGAPYLKQGIEEILVLTADGEGDRFAATVSIYKKGELTRISSTNLNNSVGGFYRAITQYLGMKPDEHEYKVMGLAPYASSLDTNRVFEIIKEWIVVDQKTLQFKTIVNSHTFLKFCYEKFKGQRFDWVAAASQKLLEVRMIEWVEAAIKKCGIQTIVASGGVFMNVKVNKLIVGNPNVKKFFVFPSSGDESNAFGACFYGFKKLYPDDSPEPIKDLYLGPSFDSDYIDNFIKRLKDFKVAKPKNLELEVAKLVARGEVVARFSGRSEWGARALGNRSILADPSNPGVVDRINRMIKNRDFWMPFAPTILFERASDYLINPKKVDSAYMMLAFDSTPLARKELKAAMHPYDFTLRPQILSQDYNPDYYKLIKEFELITGIGAVLNTSFNLHGYPIVLSPENALDAFENSGLEYMTLESYLVSKKAIKAI